MELAKRLHDLKENMKVAKDDARYAVAERLRDFGYINFADFYIGKPQAHQVSEIEGLLTKLAV